MKHVVINVDKDNYEVVSIGAVIRGKQEYTNGLWFVNDDDNAVDLTKSKLYYVDKTRLTAADEASVDFVSQVITD